MHAYCIDEVALTRADFKDPPFPFLKIWHAKKTAFTDLCMSLWQATSCSRELISTCCDRAQKEKQYDAAIEHYSKAIGSCGDAPPKFAAILSANRAASYQAKGLHAEAIADALRATALDPTYTKV